MKLTMQETEEFLTLPEDAVIQVIVSEITDREVPGRDGKEGWTSLSFRFKILEVPSYLGDEFDALIGSTIFGSIGAKLTNHPDNKAKQWTEALLDMELESGFELETDMLVGRKARAVIGNYTKKDSTVVNHKVKGLLPIVPVSVGSSGTSTAAATPFSFSDAPPF